MNTNPDTPLVAIGTYKHQGDEAFAAHRYKDAFYAYHYMGELLFEHLNKIKKTRRYARAAGWTLALLTGGLGPADVIIIPAVNKLAFKVLNINRDEYLAHVQYALRQKCRALAFIELPVKMKEGWYYNEEHALYDFLLLYILTASEKDLLGKLIELTIVDISSHKPRPSISPAELSDKLFTYMEYYKPGIEEINLSFFMFLHNHGKTDSPFNQRLKLKGYTTAS